MNNVILETNPNEAIGSLVEGFLISIINSIADPIFVKDINHQWVLLNNAFCVFIGHTKDELLGKSDYDFFPKDQSDIFWQKDEEVLKSGLGNKNEEKFTDARGKVRVIITKKAVYEDNLGQKYIVGIIRDITEIKEVENNNRKHTEELEKINQLMMGRELKITEMENELAIAKQRLENCEKTKS